MSRLTDRHRVLVGQTMAVTSIVLSLAAIGIQLAVDARVLYSEWIVHNAIGGMVLAVLGWLLVGAQPRNRAAWLFPWTALFQALNALGAALEFEATERLGLPVGAPVIELGVTGAIGTLLSTAAWVPGVVPLVTLALLWFPDGRLPSQRWRPVEWLAITATVGLTLSFGWSSHPFGGVVTESSEAGGPMASVSFLAVGLSVAFSVAGLVIRYRRSQGGVRRQFRWIAWATGTTAVLWLAANIVDAAATGQPGGASFQAIGLVTFPLFCAGYAVAIWRHQLFDIDVAISRTLLFGFLAVFIGAVYVAVVFGLGTVIGQQSGGGQALSLLATVIVAFLFQPVRQRLERAANRLVYGPRATPYEVLSDLSGRLARTESSEGMLDRMVKLVADGTGAERAVLWRWTDAGYEPLAAWPSDGVVERTAKPGESEVAVPIERAGQRLGTLTVSTSRGDELNPTERRLLDDLAGSAALVLDRARLDRALSEQAAALVRSRRRLIDAQEEERHRLESQLQTGTQQQLRSLARGLDASASLAGRAGLGPIADQLVTLVEEARTAHEEIRTLAKGFHPPVLEADGLTAAVQSLAASSPVAVDVWSEGRERYDLDVELAVYFCIAEALTNVVKHAHASTVSVRLDLTGRDLSFEVRDDGIGLGSANGGGSGTGLAGLRDRIEAVGGMLTVSSVPGQGTTIAGSVETEVPAAQPVAVSVG